MTSRRRAEYKGRGELARLVLAHAKVPYDDIRYEPAEWAEKKEKMPYGQLPVLEWRGQLLPQSLTIVRFLARRHNLAGTDEWQAARIDAFVDLIGDALNEARPIFEAGQDEEKKKEAIDNFFKNAVDPLFNRVEKQLKDDGGDYLFAGQLSLADLALFNLYDFIAGMFGADRLPKCQHVAALYARVGQIPSIRAWIEKRPVTPY